MVGNDTEDSTVLVVDDQRELVDLFEAFLADSYAVRTATSGSAALEEFDEAVDVALLDRRMPDMAGGEVLSRIRGNGHSVPVAMITAVDPDTDIVDMAFDDYVTKPVDRDELRSVVEVLLTRKEYDTKSREFFQLASKKAALESSPSLDEMESEEYHSLVTRLETLQEEITETLGDLAAADAEYAYQMI